MRRGVWAGVLLLVASVSTAHADESVEALASMPPACACSEPEPEAVAPARSLGWPWRGSLAHGQRLVAAGPLRIADDARDAGRHFGTPALVGLLERVAARVAAEHPGSVLTVGELSAEGGGDVPGHASHENGRDVDVGFYLRDGEGAPVRPSRFVNVRRSGRGELEGVPLRFDDAANFTLVASLVTDPHVVVHHAFVHPHIRARLLRWGKRHGASEGLLTRIGRVVMSPHAAHPHRNHFHVRIYCSADDAAAGCKDRGPYWPWLAEGHPWRERLIPIPGIAPALALGSS